MAHFAEINSDNIVQRVIVVDNNDCKDTEGNESEVFSRYYNTRFKYFKKIRYYFM